MESHVKVMCGCLNPKNSKKFQLPAIKPVFSNNARDNKKKEYNQNRRVCAELEQLSKKMSRMIKIMWDIFFSQ